MSKIRYRIGFLTESINEDYQFSILNGINDYATNHNLDIIRFTHDFVYSDNKYPNQYELLFNLSEKFNLDGILNLSLYSDLDSKKNFLSKIKNIPIVNLGRFDKQYHNIYINDTIYIEQIIEHLITEHNYKKILYICPINSDERLQVYSNVMKKHNIYNQKFIINNASIEMPTVWNIKDNERIKKIYSFLKDTMNMNFDAIFIPYADEAIVFCDLLNNDNFKTPDDIAVITGEDTLSCRTFSPQLTSIYYPYYEIGYLGCETLHTIINGDNVQKNIILKSKILYRNSCGCSNLNNTKYDSEVIIKTKNDISFDDETKFQIIEYLRNNLKLFSCYEILFTFEEAIQKSNINILYNWIESFNFENEYSMDKIKLFTSDILCFRYIISKYFSINEELWIEIQTIINNIFEKVSPKYTFNQSKYINSINELTPLLITCFSYDKIKSLLSSNLPKLNIKHCSILFIDDYNLQNLKLWYKFHNGQITENHEDSNPSNFDFDDFFTDARHTYLVNILNNSDDLIGFNIYEYDIEINNIYNLITSKIASAIKCARVHEQLKIANFEINKQFKLLQYTQKQLIQTDKLSALTNLIIGITNELNSPVGLSLTETSIISNTTQQILDNIIKDETSIIDLNEQLVKIKDSSNLTLKSLNKINSLIKTFRMLSTDLIVLDKKVFNFKDYINDILVNLILQINKYKHKIEIYCDKDLNICSYPGVFSIIITNLVSNTLKHSYCKQDFVEIQIKVSKSYNKIELVYQDKGEKIPNEILPKIFEPFFTTNRNKGLGLGLHIVYNLVTLKLNGNIKYTSLPSGNIFTITFIVESNNN